MTRSRQQQVIYRFRERPDRAGGAERPGAPALCRCTGGERTNRWTWLPFRRLEWQSWRGHSGGWLLVGLLLLATLVAAPVQAQRLVSQLSGSLVWTGDDEVPPANEPGEAVVGATESGYARAYLVFRPLPPESLLGSGPVRLYFYVLNLPRAGQGQLALTLYTVAPRFDARSAQAEQDSEGSFLWQQMSRGTIVAEGETSDLVPPPPLPNPAVAAFRWFNAPTTPQEPLLVDGQPAPGWHYLELDAYASRDLRAAARQAQAAGAHLRLGLMARRMQGALRLAGASERGYEPTLSLGPTTVLELAGPGGARINGVEYDLPFQGEYPTGQPLTIEALPPAPEAQFSGWSGDLQSGSRLLRVDLHEPLQLVARYRTARTRLQVWAVGGRVELDGWSPDRDWSRELPYGAMVRLRAVPDPGYRFVCWEGDAGGEDPWLDLYMDGDREVWAVFERMRIDSRARLWVSGYGGYVLVNGYPEALPFWDDFCYGDLVHLTAVAWPGYRFLGWDGDSGWTSSRTIWVRMDGWRSVRAVFGEVWDRPGPGVYCPPRGGYYPPDRRQPPPRGNYDKPYPERQMSPPGGRGEAGRPPDKPYPERRMSDPGAGDRPDSRGGEGRPALRPSDREPDRGGRASSPPAGPRSPEARAPQPGDKPPAQQPPASHPPSAGSHEPSRGGSPGQQPPAPRSPQAQPEQPREKPPTSGGQQPSRGEGNNPSRGGDRPQQPPAQQPPQAQPQPPREQPPARQPDRPQPGERPRPEERPNPPREQPPANNPNRPQPEERPRPEERPKPPREQPPADHPNRPKPDERPKPEERPRPPETRPQPPAEQPPPRPRPKPEDPPENRPAPAPPPRERPQPPPQDPPRVRERPRPEERPKPEERPRPQDKPEEPERREKPDPPRGGVGGRRR